MESNESINDLDAEVVWVAGALRPCKYLHTPLWVYDIDNKRILWCNENALEIWQSSSELELLSRDMGENLSQTVSKRLEQYKVDLTNNAKLRFSESWTLYPNGEPITFNMDFSSFRLSTGRICMLCEVKNKKDNNSEALRSTEALLHTSVSISLYAASGESLYRNPAARSSVIAADSTLEQHFSSAELIDQLHNPNTDEVNVVTSVHTIHGDKWHDITARRCMDSASGQAAWLISEVDVSRLKATEERAQFLAEHDTLTKLPNRNYVSLYFQSHIDKLLLAKKTGALVFVDLDNFKDVNDTLGHDAGDQLLVEVSDRLRKLSVADNSVARLGGDEFLLLVEIPEIKLQIDSIAQELIDLVSQPILIQGRELQVTPSIGVAVFPANGLNVKELMRHADLAMYHAKDSGKNNFAFFTTDLSDAVSTRINLETDIKSAFKNDEFEAYFQPRVDVSTGAIVGAEALARWQHKAQGMITPDVFIPACEESGLISGLGKIIFTQAIIAQRTWAEMGHELSVSVNLSPLQFSEQNLEDDLIELTRQHQGDPTKIELEITESVLLGNDLETIEKLHRLVEYGFKISIDDFGTGYSSLSYLQKYPISCLKIDRSFIDSIITAKPIVELIISMAKLFDLSVVAEGVETVEQLELLQSYECHEYQGYLFEKPIEFDQFTRMIASHAKRVA